MKPITRLCKEDINKCLCNECLTYQCSELIKDAKEDPYKPEALTERRIIWMGFAKEYNCVKVVGFDDWVEPKS